jgi:hypothetical protein
MGFKRKTEIVDQTNNLTGVPKRSTWHYPGVQDLVTD